MWLRSRSKYRLRPTKYFTATDAVASPWTVGNCPRDYYKVTDCHGIDGKYISNKERKIYNEDGTLWYAYKDRVNSIKRYRSDFFPFASPDDFGWVAILKMFAESEHWYQVEVDAKTHAVKYILKSDADWEKTSWDLWLARMEFFNVQDTDRVEVYDKPGGELVETAPESKMKRLLYTWAKGKAIGHMFRSRETVISGLSRIPEMSIATRVGSLGEWAGTSR